MATVLSLFEEKVRENHEVERIHITRYRVGGCLGCYKCQEKKDEPGCVQKDDPLPIFEKMIQADAIGDIGVELAANPAKAITG